MLGDCCLNIVGALRRCKDRYRHDVLAVSLQLACAWSATAGEAAHSRRLRSQGARTSWRGDRR